MEKCILVCFVLRNYLRHTDNAHYLFSCLKDLEEDKDDNLQPGEWRLLKGNDCNNTGLVNLPHVRALRKMS